MRKTVYVLGNPIELLDKPAIRLLPQLRKTFKGINFLRYDPTEELQPQDKDLIIIDTVLGIKKVTKFNGLNRWIRSPRVTAHDYDLPLTLGILKKLRKIKKIIIIGIPGKGEKTKIIKGIKKILDSI